MTRLNAQTRLALYGMAYLLCAAAMIGLSAMQAVLGLVLERMRHESDNPLHEEIE